MTATESVRPTRHEGLAYVKDGPALWRFAYTLDGPKPNGLYPRVGPHYPTRAELLSDLDRYARVVGWIETTTTDPPGLLQAVQDVIPDLEHYVSTHGPGPDLRLAALKAAIAKATTS